EEAKIDLDLVDLLHAPDVRVAELLERVDERARSFETGSRVDDLVAVRLAPAALGLVLRVQRQALDRRRGWLHTLIVGTRSRAAQDLTNGTPERYVRDPRPWPPRPHSSSIRQR